MLADERSDHIEMQRVFRRLPIHENQIESNLVLGIIHSLERRQYHVRETEREREREKNTLI